MRRNNRLRIETLDNIKDKDHILFIDVETTGLKADAKIIQFAALYCELCPDGTINNIDTLNHYINPRCKVPEKVKKLTGLDNDFLSQMEDEETIFPVIDTYLSKRLIPGTLIASYNIGFDIGKVQAMYTRQNRVLPSLESLDVMKIAKDVLLADGLENYRLQTCVSHLGLATGLHFHSAMDDVYAAERLLEYCIKEYIRQTYDELSDIEVQITGAQYFVNPMRKSMRRIIVYTTLGEIYYDTVNGGWGVKKNSEMAESTFKRLDLDKIEDDLLKRFRYDTMDALVKRLEKIYRENQKK